MIVKMKSTQTVETEMEFPLPYFFKLTYKHIGDTYYGVFSDKKAVRVSMSNYEISTNENPECYLGFNSKENFEEVKHEDFIKAFDKAVLMLGQFVKTQIKF